MNRVVCLFSSRNLPCGGGICKLDRFIGRHLGAALSGCRHANGQNPSISRKGNREPAFTLVEMIAAIAIIAILAAILVPVVEKIRESGNASKCISNMKQIGAVAGLVIADNDGRLPERLDFKGGTANIEEYIYPQPKGRPKNGIFHCPKANNTKKSSLGASLGESYPDLSYGRNQAIIGPDNLPYKVSQILQPSKRALAWESSVWNISITDTSTRYAPRHRGAPKVNNSKGEAATILFIDGHVEIRVMSMNPIDQAEWDELGIPGARQNMTK